MSTKMRNKLMLSRLLYVGAAAALIGFDRLVKWLVVRYIDYRDSVVVIKGLLDFTHWHNDGAAFGILSGRQTFLIIVTSVFLITALGFLLSPKIKSKFTLIAITLIISGGVGNWIDRVVDGYVVDYIELKFINFAIFNFADMCAVAGAFMLFFVVIADEVRHYKAKKACEVELETAAVPSESETISDKESDKDV
ncbi:MAG: signal peptidase II [Oscillospiraceae bacterium]|nr:signal peptidase II [Oscillospiraceae bacterium]